MEEIDNDISFQDNNLDFGLELTVAPEDLAEFEDNESDLTLDNGKSDEVMKTEVKRFGKFLYNKYWYLFLLL